MYIFIIIIQFSFIFHLIITLQFMIAFDFKMYILFIYIISLNFIISIFQMVKQYIILYILIWEKIQV
jgi:hypothetical protein